MGPLAENFYLEKDKILSLHDNKDLKNFTKAGLDAYVRGRKLKRMTNLFNKSNKGWRLLHHDQRYGTTYQTANPSDWGKHNLFLNLLLVTAKHVKKCMEKLQEEKTSYI